MRYFTDVCHIPKDVSNRKDMSFNRQLFYRCTFCSIRCICFTTLWNYILFLLLLQLQTNKQKQKKKCFYGDSYIYYIIVTTMLYNNIIASVKCCNKKFKLIAGGLLNSNKIIVAKVFSMEKAVKNLWSLYNPEMFLLKIIHVRNILYPREYIRV